MLNPDLDLARRFVLAQPVPGAQLLCAVTGSHLYGFPSPDSDLDLKAIHLAPTQALLGLDPVGETFDTLVVEEGVELDFTSHEAGKALRLLLQGNGNMLERILSPLQLFEGAPLVRLQALARGAVSKKFYAHYAGFFRGMCREHEREPSAKSMLYSYRVALTGAHLLRTGDLVADLRPLAKEAGLTEVGELVELKRAGGEHVALSAEEDERFRSRWRQLEEWLAVALEKSTLPDEPSNRSEVDAWLREARLSGLTASR